MLVELRCEAFKEAGRIRPPIRFHEGLNVVLGTRTGDNSIGKSTFLLILDFVFGGDDYATKIRDAANHVGEHTIQFEFRFAGTRYFFSRGTATFTTVERCDEKYHPIETWPVQQYRTFLAEHYGLNESGLSFRETVTRFIRVYHRENHNELRPLDAYPNEKGTDVIKFLLKLFGRFNVLQEAESQAKQSKDSLNALRDGIKFGHILSVGTKKEADALVEQLRNLQRLRDSTGHLVDFQGKTAEDAMRVAGIKRDLQVVRARKSRLEDKLERLGFQQSIPAQRFLDDFREVERLFPGISLARLEAVESFHRKLTEILSSEIAEEIVLTQSELKKAETELRKLEANLASEPGLDDVPQRILKAYAEYDSQIKSIERRLQKREEEETLKRSCRVLTQRYKDQCDDALKGIEKEINLKMLVLDTLIYEGTKYPPDLRLSSIKYEFSTLDDEGTGTAYKSMVVMDIAFLAATSLPFLVHDSLIFKNIGDKPLSKLIQMYQQQAPKQVFIALDKADSYDNATCLALEEQAVLHLAEGERALFGESWSEKTPESD